MMKFPDCGVCGHVSPSSRQDELPSSSVPSGEEMDTASPWGASQRAGEDSMGGDLQVGAVDLEPGEQQCLHCLV